MHPNLIIKTYISSKKKYIYILLIDRSNKTAIIIENKINHHDINHDDEAQLEKYYRIIIPILAHILNFSFVKAL